MKMARETRHTGKDVDHDASGSKRKRRPSTSPAPITPNPASTTAVKLIIPSPTSLSHSNGENSSPVLNGEHEPKRQRISLKISGGATATISKNLDEGSPSKLRSVVEDDEDDGNIVVAEDVGEEKVVLGAVLPEETREALALIISQMAQHLPAPLNNILTLWLPPDFVQKEENTLSYVLRQPALTWEQLVETLHVFSENLLVPCAYPNPMPSLAQFHLPVPPLPSHLPPHVIYNFCASLHSLMSHIAPSTISGVPSKRWALMQKTPSNLQSGVIGGEWFTASVDQREADKVLRKIKKEDGTEDSKDLLKVLADAGDKFGYALPVAIGPSHVAGSSGFSKIPKLNDTLLRRASLKMTRWKELREARRAGGFGSVLRGVHIPQASSTSFTPSFAPTFDSTHSAGGMGYWSTISAMHERHRHREYSLRTWGRAIKSDEQVWQGVLDVKDGKDEVEEVTSKENGLEGKSVDDKLEENQRMIEELKSWQYLRLRRGSESWVSGREQVVAEVLLSSLTSLASNTTPSSLLPEASTSQAGLAHSLTKRFIPISSPVIRGTLDPRRPQALHDNTTIRIRNSSSIPSASPALTSPSHTASLKPNPYMYQPPTANNLSQPPPHTVSSGPGYGGYPRSNNPTPTYPSSQRNPQRYFQSQSQGYSSQPHIPYTYSTGSLPPSPYSTHSGPQGTPLPPAGYRPPMIPGPGPSGLRQSFGNSPSPGYHVLQQRNSGTPSRPL